MSKKFIFLLILSSFVFPLFGAEISFPREFDVVNRYYFNFLMDVKDPEKNHLGTIHCDSKPIKYELKNPNGELIAEAFLTGYHLMGTNNHWSRLYVTFDICDAKGTFLGKVREFSKDDYTFYDKRGYYDRIIAQSFKINRSFWTRCIEIRDLKENNPIAIIESSYYSSHVEVKDEKKFAELAPHILLIPIGLYCHNPHGSINLFERRKIPRSVISQPNEPPSKQELVLAELEAFQSIGLEPSQEDFLFVEEYTENLISGAEENLEIDFQVLIEILNADSSITPLHKEALYRMLLFKISLLDS